MAFGEGSGDSSEGAGVPGPLHGWLPLCTEDPCGCCRRPWPGGAEVRGSAVEAAPGHLPASWPWPIDPAALSSGQRDDSTWQVVAGIRYGVARHRHPPQVILRCGCRSPQTDRNPPCPGCLGSGRSPVTVHLAGLRGGGDSA